ncbi:M23 family metallopeptidase [Candidatus Aerophobetes bacterium]|nr:M23 family metallopeptidase [Candidatus Aerophobetes bacterium]
MRKKEWCTLVVVPNGGDKRVRRVVISKFAFFSGIILIGMLLAMLAFFITDYREIRAKVTVLEELKRVNKQQQEKIVSLAKKVQDFDETLQKLKELESRLRNLAGMSKAVSVVEREELGKGGPEDYSLERGLEEKDPFILTDQMEESFPLLEKEAQKRIEGFQQVEKIILQKKELFASTPNIFPVQGWLTSKFGWRKDPFTGKREFHKAIDISAPWGTSVRASAQGKVIFTGWKDGFGLMIEINHGYGYSTVYAHLSKILVKKGTWVSKGDIIGRVGSTGRSTGPHLHFEVHRNKKAVDPLSLMVEPLG